MCNRTELSCLHHWSCYCRPWKRWDLLRFYHSHHPSRSPTQAACVYRRHRFYLRGCLHYRTTTGWSVYGSSNLEMVFFHQFTTRRCDPSSFGLPITSASSRQIRITSTANHPPRSLRNACFPSRHCLPPSGTPVGWINIPLG